MEKNRRVKRAYLVGYSRSVIFGEVEEVNLFVTYDVNVAKSYTERFNDMLLRLDTHYSAIKAEKRGLGSDRTVITRRNILSDFIICWYKEIEIR